MQLWQGDPALRAGSGSAPTHEALGIQADGGGSGGQRRQVEAVVFRSLEQKQSAGSVPGQDLVVCPALGQKHEQVAGTDDPHGESSKAGSQVYGLRIEEDAVGEAGHPAAIPRITCANDPG